MGTSDGTVISLTKILDNGPDTELCNVVLVAEGFTAAEQGDFIALCDDFLTALQAEAWYGVLGAGLNIHRLIVHSDESGTDDPTDCAGGDGTDVDTYFDAQFCNSGIRRCLSGDEGIVRDELDAALAQWHVAGVLVNTTDHGGCRSGNVFWTSVKPGWENTALHELGHAAFDLADEYDYWAGCDEDEPDQNIFTDPEPDQFNVTTITNPANLKWRHLLTPGVPVPSMENPDCDECDERANVLGDDLAIGLFEGAKYHHCGVFRPAYTCRMRSSTQDFCRVCAEQIAVSLGDFVDADPILEVTPVALDFGEIAYGLTLYLAFEVRNVRSGHPMPLDVTLTPPTGGFTYAPDTELAFTLPAPIFESYTSRNVYVAFTSTSAGGPGFAGEAAVTAGAQGATVNLDATAVPPVPVDSVLVIDRSGSMDDPTGVLGLRKVDMAVEAGHLFVDLLKENDQVGIVRYNDASGAGDVLLTMRAAGDLGTGQGRIDAKNQINTSTLDPDDGTSIGAGIINGSNLLDNAAADARALVVLTDGRQNTSPDVPDARAVVEAKAPAQRVFAVGLGLNQLEDTLNEIASVTNGVAQVTGDLVDEREFLLQKLYVQILSDISGEAFVKDPVQYLRAGQCAATHVYLSEIDISCDFILTWRPSPVYPKYLKVWLEAPDGSIIDTAAVAAMPNADLVTQPTHMFFRVLFPLRPDSPLTHAGLWKVWVEPQEAHTTANTGGDGLHYAVMAKARSNFMLPGYLEQVESLPGARMRIVLQPTLFGRPVALDLPVRATVTRPDGVVRTVDLAEGNDGTYAGLFDDTPLIGPYGVDVEVSATSPHGHRVTRYRHLTGLIFYPRRDEGGGDGGGHGRGECDGDGDGTRPGEERCQDAWKALQVLASVLRECCGTPQQTKTQVAILKRAVDDLVADLDMLRQP